MEEYVHVYAAATHYFTSWHPNEIEKAFIEILEKKEIEPKVHETKYKISFEDEDEDENKIGFCVRILSIPENSSVSTDAKYCLEFSKIAGDKFSFNK